MENSSRKGLVRIAIFLIFTFAVTYFWTIFLIWPRVFCPDMATDTPEDMMMTTLFTAALMFFPAMGVLITRLVTAEGFRNSMLCLNLRGNVRYYIVAWFGPIALTLAGAAVYFLIYPDEFSLSAFYDTTGGRPVMTVLLIFLSPLLNLIPCFGEEWGWRGYLLPKLTGHMNLLPSVLLSGLIWGLWHAPVIVSGHNYSIGYWGYPWLGIVAMCLFCVVLGTLLSYITLRTKSCWPAVIAHGAINGVAGLAILCYNTSAAPLNPFIGPIPTGIIGGFAYIVVALWIAWKIRKECAWD